VHDYGKRAKIPGMPPCKSCEGDTRAHASEEEKLYIMNAMKGCELTMNTSSDVSAFGVSIEYFEAPKICGDC
jgi:hypothetical protein